MITKMKKLTFLVYHKEYEEFLNSLRELGVVHIVEKQQGAADNTELQENIRLFNRLAATLKLLQNQKHEKNAVIATEGGTATRGMQVLDEVDALQTEHGKLSQQLQSYAKEKEVLEVWGNFEQTGIQKLKDAGYIIGFYSCSEGNYKEEWETEYNAMVAFARPLESFSEIFQYDILHPVLSAVNTAEGASCPLETHVIARNVQMFLSRLPKKLQDPFRDQFRRVDTAVLDYYPALMPYLLAMDRAHVFATDVYGHYHLAGLFASFPSDMDGEIKRFGLRTGKFKIGDNEMYERNRTFVCQFLMELYGFPISSERRTSAALFSRRLHKLGERFLVRVLGQSDRTITTIWNNGENRPYPRVEKIALVKLDPEQKDLIRACEEGGFFVDAEKRVVIIRISYKQHRYNADNVRQDRALSVERQELIHPLTGRAMPDVNVVKDTSTMILRLNDIVRGEYVGRAVYKRNELVENTDTDEKRLKFLFAWLSKNQRRIIGYSEEFYNNTTKVLDAYLKNPENQEAFALLHDLKQEVMSKYAYIRQARTVRYLEDIVARNYKGERLTYGRMLLEAIELLRDLKFELGNYFEPLMLSVLHYMEMILDDRYLLRRYINCPDEKLSKGGVEIRKNYRRLVSLRDEFESVRKSRQKPVTEG